jgi:hypothetical protein
MGDGPMGRNSAGHRAAGRGGFNAFILALASGAVPEGCPEPEGAVLEFARDAERDARAGRFTDDPISVLAVLRMAGAPREAVEAGRRAHALYLGLHAPAEGARP